MPCNSLGAGLCLVEGEAEVVSVADPVVVARRAALREESGSLIVFNLAMIDAGSGEGIRLPT